MVSVERTDDKETHRTLFFESVHFKEPSFSLELLIGIAGVLGNSVGNVVQLAYRGFIEHLPKALWRNKNSNIQEQQVA